MAAAAVNPYEDFVDQEQLRLSSLRTVGSKLGSYNSSVWKSTALPPTPPPRVRLNHHFENISHKDDTDKEVSEMEISKEIGCGSFWTVHEVTFRRKECAVKMFQQVVAEEKPRLYKTLSAECDHLRKLAHPNIVQFYGVYYHDQQQLPVMVMELMDESLTTFVRKSNIRIGTKLSLLHGVAMGLRYLHSVPVVHGDLSPNNVLLKFIGNDGTLPIAKIADLGLAKFKCQYSNKPQSVDFLAPEALVQKPKYDTPIDVFAFGGITLYTINEEWPTPEKEPTINFSKYESHQKFFDTMRSMIEACLSDDPVCRPSIAVVIEEVKLALAQLNNAERTNIDTLLSQAEHSVTHSEHDEEASRLPSEKDGEENELESQPVQTQQESVKLKISEISHQQQDVNAVKFTLSVQDQHDLKNSPLVMTDERLMKQLNVRLSALERDIKTIKDAVNNISLEEKLGRAIENIEANFGFSQREPVYYTTTEAKASSLMLSRQLQDETYIYAAGSNEYTEEQFYETVPETSVKKVELPKLARHEYDYATTGHGPVTRYMTLSDTNCDSSGGSYHYTQTIRQPRIQQVELVEEEKLANGKSGEVWLAFDKKDGSKMVIKKPISKEIFFQEQSALKNISHHNVVRLIDSSITKSPVLIFEYAEKGNLLKCLKSSTSSFSPLKLLAISAGVACGMSELEKRVIIHCDVMAKSILIDSHFVCKVASFSKARCLKPGESSYVPHSSVTVSRLPIKWAAPEVLSERKFSVKSDVWAFGVLLSEVFSQGSTPYPNMNNDKVKSDVQNGIKMAQPSDCPDEVYEVMKGCFEFHAENRPLFADVHQQLMELHGKNPSSSGSECDDL